MASYADKVRGGARISGSANEGGQGSDRPQEQRQTEGQDASNTSHRAANATRTVEEVFKSQGLTTELPHPTKAQEGEQLPSGYSRSYAGLLIKDLKREIQVNQDAVKCEMDFLQNFAVIAFFIGRRPLESQMQGWLETLKVQVQGPLVRGRNIGRGFFIIKADDHEVVKNLLLLTPFQSNQGLCVFQRWSPNFDPEDELGGASRGPRGGHQGFKIPTWITLRNVREEFMGVAQEIAAGIGEVLGTEDANDSLKDPRFCVGLSAGGGWEQSVVVTNPITKQKHTILIDYNFLPIRCRACGDTTHCLKECPQRQEQGRSKGKSFQPRDKENRPGPGRSGQDPRTHRQKPRENSGTKQPEIDEEGFQRPKQKSWRGYGHRVYQPGGIDRGTHPHLPQAGHRNPAPKPSDLVQEHQEWPPAAYDAAKSPAEEQPHADTSSPATRNQEGSTALPQSQLATRSKAPTAGHEHPPREEDPSNQASTFGTSPSASRPKGQQLVVYSAGQLVRNTSMAWSPERLSGKKRARSPRESRTHSASSSRRLNPLQDLNSLPMDGDESRAPHRTCSESNNLDPMARNLIGESPNHGTGSRVVQQGTDADRMEVTRLGSPNLPPPILLDNGLQHTRLQRQATDKLRARSGGTIVSKRRAFDNRTGRPLPTPTTGSGCQRGSFRT
jgi:hypothetical protein